MSTQTYRPIETFTIAAFIYLAISFPIGQLAAYVERRNARRLAG